MLPDLPAGRTVVLDGGLATALEARGHDLGDALWSARLLADDPDAIVAVHRAYFRAGADVATTASYQASFDGFAARGVDRAQADRLLRRSVALARRARDGSADDGRRRWVAASVGPYGASLADGSEYRGRYGRSVAALAAWHRPRLDVLVDALAGSPVPAWLSFSVAGSRTRAGQPLDEAFAVVAGAPEIVAVGVDCCAPADVGPAVATARAVTGKPVVVYPNSGERWDAVRRRWTGSSRRGSAGFDVTQAAGWVAAGATAVGGCCRVGPADIAALARVVRRPRRAGTRDDQLDRPGAV